MAILINDHTIIILYMKFPYIWGDNMNFQNIINRVDNLSDWIIKIRRDIHETPELAMEEYTTKEKIKKYLDEIGVEYIEFKSHRGIMAYIIKNPIYKTIAIRADIDALPIKEKNNKLYKSKHDGVMHACGHDAHTAMLIGACKVLYDMKNELKVNVKFLFQGAEEQFGGAKYLIDDGCLQNPKVDYIFGLHVQANLEVGQIECKNETLNASSNSLNIKIKGKRAHGAYPENGVDALVCSAQIITSLQSIISRNISPTNMAVLTLGKIYGGEAQNVICEDVEINGTIRSLNEESRKLIIDRVKEIVENTAKAYGCKSDIYVENYGYPPVINDKELVDIIKFNTEKLLCKEAYKEKEYPSMGAEDFSFYTQDCKGTFFHLGCGNKQKGINSLIHTDTFDIDEDCLVIGSTMHVLNVLYFNDK